MTVMMKIQERHPGRALGNHADHDDDDKVDGDGSDTNENNGISENSKQNVFRMSGSVVIMMMMTMTKLMVIVVIQMIDEYFRINVSG